MSRPNRPCRGQERRSGTYKKRTITVFSVLCSSLCPSKNPDPSLDRTTVKTGMLQSVSFRPPVLVSVQVRWELLHPVPCPHLRPLSLLKFGYYGRSSCFLTVVTVRINNHYYLSWVPGVWTVEFVVRTTFQVKRSCPKSIVVTLSKYSVEEGGGVVRLRLNVNFRP